MYSDYYFVDWLHAIPSYLQYLHLLQSVNTPTHFLVDMHNSQLLLPVEQNQRSDVRTFIDNYYSLGLSKDIPWSLVQHIDHMAWSQYKTQIKTSS